MTRSKELVLLASLGKTLTWNFAQTHQLCAHFAHTHVAVPTLNVKQETPTITISSVLGSIILKVNTWKAKKWKSIEIPLGHNCPHPPKPDHGDWDCRQLDAPMDFPITERSSWKCESNTPRKSKWRSVFVTNILIQNFQPCSVVFHAILATSRTLPLSSSARGVNISRSIRHCSSVNLLWPCLSLRLESEKYCQLENRPIVTSC